MRQARQITQPQLHPLAGRISTSPSGEATQTSVAVHAFCARQRARSIAKSKYLAGFTLPRGNTETCFPSLKSLQLLIKDNRRWGGFSSFVLLPSQLVFGDWGEQSSCDHRRATQIHPSCSLPEPSQLASLREEKRAWLAIFLCHHLNHSCEVPDQI